MWTITITTDKNEEIQGWVSTKEMPRFMKNVVSKDSIKKIRIERASVPVLPEE